MLLNNPELQAKARKISEQKRVDAMKETVEDYYLMDIVIKEAGGLPYVGFEYSQMIADLLKVAQLKQINETIAGLESLT
ncbi:hypothetical protein Q5O24_12425 [Eubacteriaceae bacterium ES3]|nr:hypothetical protein Q5O24_12425 [Eubacteriaceae bacterium ES3]